MNFSWNHIKKRKKSNSSAGIQKTGLPLDVVCALVNEASFYCGHILSAENFTPQRKKYLGSFALICCYKTSVIAQEKSNLQLKTFQRNHTNTFWNAAHCETIWVLVNTFTRSQSCAIPSLCITQYIAYRESNARRALLAGTSSASAESFTFLLHLGLSQTWLSSRSHQLQLSPWTGRLVKRLCCTPLQLRYRAAQWQSPWLCAQDQSCHFQALPNLRTYSGTPQNVWTWKTPLFLKWEHGRRK